MSPVVLVAILSFLVVLIPVAIDARLKGPLKAPLTFGSLGILAAAGVLAAGGERRALATIVPAAALTTLYCLVSLWMRRRGDRAAHTAREEALSLGIRVEDVEREMPYFERNGKLTLKTDTCVRYSLPRQAGGYPETWAFLMRSEAHGAQYPNGWFFRSATGAPAPAPMDELLRTIASEEDEDYLEFEGDPREVSAFLADGGGADRVRRIHGWLRALGRA
jgi:hypothetical protein